MDRQTKLDWELQQAFDNGSDWYTGHLYRLIAKADPSNRELLRLSYPEHVEAYERFMRGENSFYEKENLTYKEGLNA